MENFTIFGFNLGPYLTIEYLSMTIRFGLLILVGIPLVLLLSKWTKRYGQKKLTSQQSMLFEKLVLYLGLSIILISILNEFGFKLSHLLGAAGILGIAIGFASQTSVSNIISGLFLIAEKPFEIDDVIKVGDTTGVVLSIDLLSIKLRTFDNRFVRIPNETLIKSEVTTITKFPIRRVDINLGVAYKENIERVRGVLLEIAKKNPLCLNEPEPIIIFSGFGNSSIDLFFGVWAAKPDWLKLKNTIMEEIKKRFDEEGIEIPFPHVTLYTGNETKPLPINIVNKDSLNN